MTPVFVLFLTGTGTSSNDVKAVEAVPRRGHLKHAAVSSHELNGMSVTQLLAYRLMIVPGGNYITIGNSSAPYARCGVFVWFQDVTANTPSGWRRAQRFCREVPQDRLDECHRGVIFGNGNI